MTAGAALAGAFQLADSALPIGRFVHSYGVEPWLRERPEPTPDQLAELVATTVVEAAAPLDGAAVALAHRAANHAELCGLDRRITARKLTPAARDASLRCGRQLAALAPALAPNDQLLVEFADGIVHGDSDGNLAVIHGTLSRALGVDAGAAVLIELRGTAAAQLSAAVRLGALSPTQAQALLAALAPTLTHAVALALALGPDQLRSTAPELELYAMAHRRIDARLFAT